MASQIEEFGPYVLLKKLATGGMAEIFLARPAASGADGRLLVVKRVLPHIARQPHFQTMFRQEAEVLMGFTHPRIVQPYDFGIVDNQPYIAMEYLEGKNLRDVGKRLKEAKARLPMATALEWTAQAATGLHYAHTFEHKISGKPLNTVHRDVSPQNLIVSFDGNLKIVDFGIAKADGHTNQTTMIGTLKGTAGYFSPEQLHGGKVDHRTDIFSLGVVAWELLTGQGLFAKPGDTEAFVLMKMSQFENYLQPPSAFNREIPFDIDRAILKALERNPARRYHHAREFAEELRRLLVKHCPDYVFTQGGEMLKQLFKDDLRDLRRETVELNQRAEETLTLNADHEKSRGEREKNMAFRLRKMEFDLQQKATTRHYVLLAVYLISIVALKFDDLRQIWRNHTGTTAQIASVTRQPASAMDAPQPPLLVASRGAKPQPAIALGPMRPTSHVSTRSAKPHATRSLKPQAGRKLAR